MRRVDYKEVAQRVLTRIDQGAFLTVKSGEAINTMTIGWLTIGYAWRTPILMVAVRSSRHTFSIIEVSDDFTVSIPSLNMQREIEFCGTKSGRDYDKFKECNLQISESQDVATPIIRVPGIHFECKIMYKSAMDRTYLNEEHDRTIYPENDYHTLYFGKIMNCYEIDQG